MNSKKELVNKVNSLTAVINKALENNITDIKEIKDIQQEISLLAREIKNASLFSYSKKRLMNKFCSAVDKYQTCYYRLIKDNTVTIISNRLLIHRKFNEQLYNLYGSEYLRDFKENSILYNFF